jgi:hypothetical protein
MIFIEKHFLLMYDNKKLYYYISKIHNWRHSQVVRQGIANPSSPVQIWVPPNNLIILGVWWNGRHNRLKIC